MIMIRCRSVSLSLSLFSGGPELIVVHADLRNKFGVLHQQSSPNKDRELYIHFTAVTDTRRTATIIQSGEYFAPYLRPPVQELIVYVCDAQCAILY